MINIIVGYLAIMVRTDPLTTNRANSCFLSFSYVQLYFFLSLYQRDQAVS